MAPPPETIGRAELRGSTACVRLRENALGDGIVLPARVVELIGIAGAFSASLTGLLFKVLYMDRWPRRVTRLEQLEEFLPAREERR